jgi:hypothetical protein
MKTLGIYTTVDGNRYALHWYPEERLAEAVGPLPDYVGTAGEAVTLNANSEEEARAKLAEALGPGTS